MIIKLSNADFSASNIGRYIAFNDVTRAILSKYSTSPSNEVSTSLNEFIVTLLDNDLYDKLQYMALPFLASNVTEGIMNVVSGDAYMSNNGGILLANQGIGYTEDTPLAQMSDIKGLSLTKDNYTLSAFNSTIIVENSLNQLIFGVSPMYIFDRCDNNGKVKTQGVFFMDNANATFSPVNTLLTPNTTTLSVNTSGLTISNGTSLYYVDGTSRGGLKTDAFTSVGFAHYTNVTSFKSNAKYSLVAVGEGLTQSQVVIWNNAVQKLMDVVLG